MKKPMRIMTESPLNAETPAVNLQSWITSNDVFFKRNQETMLESPVALDTWRLSIEGMVDKVVELSFPDILAMPKVEVANTLECSGNGRSLFPKHASGNPWTIGGVGNAVWGGVRMNDILKTAGIKSTAKHVGFEAIDNPRSRNTVKFIRSIPLGKAVDSTIVAYEMNGEPLPHEHGFPLRALALGWTGANCVKWLGKITLLNKPVTGYFMDNVYRIFQKGEPPESGEVVTAIPLKSIITLPENGAKISTGAVVVRGAAYGGETGIARVEVSIDDGFSWQTAEFIGPHEPYAWRRWEHSLQVSTPGDYTIFARALDEQGQVQPMSARWNVLGYGNNGSREHGVEVTLQ